MAKQKKTLEKALKATQRSPKVVNGRQHKIEIPNVKLATAKIIEEIGSPDHMHDVGLRKEKVPKKLT